MKILLVFYYTTHFNYMILVLRLDSMDDKNQFISFLIPMILCYRMQVQNILL